MHPENPNEDVILAPLLKRPPRLSLLLILLGVVILAATYAYTRQWDMGLAVTGLNRPIYMGIYIVNFIFFIGLAHSGTFISAILRLMGVEWRKPLTRAAEAITLFSLPFGVMAIMIDLGRPDRALNLIRFGRFQSPLLWDVTAVSLYLLSSVVFFYLSLLPDIALCRDRSQDPRHPLSRVPAWQRRMYQLLSLGWRGHPEQFRRLEKVLDGMAIFMTMLVITVHTVVSWVFGMTLIPGWHTTILGPFFLLGAIYSGLAAVVVALAILRKVFHLEKLLSVKLFNSMRNLLIAFSLGWLYMMVVEYLTTIYGNMNEEMEVVALKFSGEYALIFWTMCILCFVVPLLILIFRAKNHIGWMVSSALVINVGMWLERYMVVVPSEARPRLLTELVRGIYHPTATEFVITAALFAGMILLYVGFTQLFPIIPLWETAEEAHDEDGAEAEEEPDAFRAARRRGSPVIRMR